MAGLLVSIGVMGVVISMVLPVWNHAARREREAELIFRGEQYARAIELYQRRYAGAYPPDFETLVEERFLRRLYRDPMTDDGEFEPVFRSEVTRLASDEGEEGADEEGREDGDETGDDPAGSMAQRAGTPAFGATREDTFRGDAQPQGGVVGVVSTSPQESIRIYNGQQRYDRWLFLYAPTEATPGEASGGGAVPRPPRRGLGGQPVGEDRGRFTREGSTSPRSTGGGGPGTR